MSRYLSSPPDLAELADDLQAIGQIITALGYLYEKEPGTATMKTTFFLQKSIDEIADLLRQESRE